jgi:hypothetical protein
MQKMQASCFNIKFGSLDQIQFEINAKINEQELLIIFKYQN